MSLLLLTVTLRVVSNSNKHCLLSLFSFVEIQSSRKSRHLELKERARLLLEQARRDNETQRSSQITDQVSEENKPKSPTDDLTVRFHRTFSIIQ